MTQDYSKLLPPLSTEEFEALKSSIDAEGVQIPIIVDENGAILDGYHRYKIAPDAPRRIVTGLSEAEKLAYVFQSNFARRNLSPDQKKQARKEMQSIARALNGEGRTQRTQAEIATCLGVAQQTVSAWLGGSMRNTRTGITHTQSDSRVKVAKISYPVILERIEKGETQEQVAADYAVNQTQISRIVTAEKKHREIEQAWRKVSPASMKSSGIQVGDFRVLSQSLKDNSINIIFTDPPYNEDAVKDYEDMASTAARVLVPGGLCLAYSGQAFINDVLSVMSKHLDYLWLCAVRHSGGELRFRKYKVRNGWKPIVMFGKRPLKAGWSWFSDYVSGGKEKGLHEWQQAESEAKHYLSYLCPPKGIVLDPFCGSGTTLAAAKALGLRYMGYEIDSDTARKAMRRLQ